MVKKFHWQFEDICTTICSKKYFVLKDFLERHRTEAKAMSIFEYDQEKHMRQEREAAWEDGHLAGIEDGLKIKGKE